eukprot:scaffold250438_cov32-Prasinocladus_malaysianus.AAC.1
MFSSVTVYCPMLMSFHPARLSFVATHIIQYSEWQPRCGGYIICDLQDSQQFMGRLRRDGRAIFCSLDTLRRACTGIGEVQDHSGPEPGSARDVALLLLAAAAKGTPAPQVLPKLDDKRREGGITKRRGPPGPLIFGSSYWARRVGLLSAGKSTSAYEHHDSLTKCLVKSHRKRSYSRYSLFQLINTS